MLSSQLSVVYENALRVAQSDLDSLELTKRDLQRRIQAIQKSLGLEEDIEGALFFGLLFNFLSID